MRSKSERQRIIREVIGKGQVSSQEELAEILESQGIPVAQATLSRDIRELGVTKRHGLGGYYYSLPDAAPTRSGGKSLPGMSDSVVSVEFTGQLAVVKTRPGHANMVASVIDGSSVEEVAGTIAGDDTIILAVREGASRESLAGSLGNLLGDLGKKILN